MGECGERNWGETRRGAEDSTSPGRGHAFSRVTLRRNAANIGKTSNTKTAVLASGVAEVPPIVADAFIVLALIEFPKASPRAEIDKVIGLFVPEGYAVKCEQRGVKADDHIVGSQGGSTAQPRNVDGEPHGRAGRGGLIWRSKRKDGTTCATKARCHQYRANYDRFH